MRTDGGVNYLPTETPLSLLSHRTAVHWSIFCVSDGQNCDFMYSSVPYLSANCLCNFSIRKRYDRSSLHSQINVL
jgi:hypothetical protein